MSTTQTVCNTDVSFLKRKVKLTFFRQSDKFTRSHVVPQSPEVTIRPISLPTRMKGTQMNGSYNALHTLLKEAATRTAGGAFDRFLDKEINIGRGTRSKASTSQKHLREFLVDETERDEDFPRILQYADSDFLGGSFARHSKIWPLDDIDAYFPIDGQWLVYSQHGLRLPYTVLTDDVLDNNPLLNAPDRWMDGSYISSKKLIAGFGKVLNRHYPDQTRIRADGEAVNVQMADLGFDVVPCFSLRPDDPNEQPFYVIPDGNNGWIDTNPRIDNQISEQLQRQNEGTFRRAVKLVKWWNKNRFGDQLSSYYVELAIMRGFFSKNQWGGYVTTISDAVALGFESLRDAAWAGDQTSWIPTAPSVERGDMSTDDLQLLDTVAGAARDAVNTETAGDSESALKIWKAVFGQKFPVD